jgi:hypothetical protein
LERLAREIGLLPEPSQPDYRAEDAQSDLAAWSGCRSRWNRSMTFPCA